MHSALLTLADPKSGSTVYQSPVTIVAANDVPTDPGKKLQIQGETPWLQSSHHFFRVPPKAGTLVVEVAAQQGALTYFSLREPDCRGPAISRSANGDTTMATVKSPAAGVWELIVENGRTSKPTEIMGRPATPARYEVSISVAQSRDKGP
jgi:hypothetical protein